MSYFDEFDKGYFPCGESFFDKQDCDRYDKKDYDYKPYRKCCIEKKFLMECELKCKPICPKPCPPKPKCVPFFGCFCVKMPPKKDCW